MSGVACCFFFWKKWWELICGGSVVTGASEAPLAVYGIVDIQNKTLQIVIVLRTNLANLMISCISYFEYTYDDLCCLEIARDVADK